ncbi:MAG: CPBP family intramembrane metalloprotease [Acidobacteria bacterium]|nr:CPBP family intramembrane metalloprotease [Acidobacteriota bacterium]
MTRFRMSIPYTPKPAGRLHVLIRALVTGLMVTAAANFPWQVFVSANLRTNPAVPWSVLLMAPLMVAYWFYIGGSGWPSRTREFRKFHLRAIPLNGPAWGWSVFTMVCGFSAALVLLLGVYVRFVPIQGQGFPDTGGVPWYVIASYIGMLSIVAGVAEEAGYRGYMQSQLEAAFGPFVAILLCSLLFAATHLSLALAPFYILVSMVFGVVALVTRSVLPCMTGHFGYDLIMTTLEWQYGRPSLRFLSTGWALLIAITLILATLWGIFKLRAVRIRSN